MNNKFVAYDYEGYHHAIQEITIISADCSHSDYTKESVGLIETILAGIINLIVIFLVCVINIVINFL